MARIPPLPALALPALAAGAAWLALSGCAPNIPLVMTRPDSLGVEVPRDWESHGAYYLVDEVKVMATYEDGPIVSTPVTRWLIHKEIQITGTEGVKHASMDVPSFGSPGKLTLFMSDSAGKPMPLDTTALRRAYTAKKRIDFPNAHPGCRVGFMIALSTVNPIPWMDHWFSSDLPVLRGIFDFNYSNKHFGYEFKEYGGLAKGKEVEAARKGVTTQSWRVNRQSPRSKVGYQEGVDVTEPRVALVMRRAMGTRVFEDWRAMTSNYEKILLGKGAFASERSLRKLTDSLTRGKTGASERAAALLAYCQDNLTLVDGEIHAIRPDAVIKAHQGTLWDITVVAKSMLKAADLETRIWLTRPRDRGGLDSGFISPGALMLPLLGVKIGASWQMFFPFRRGYALGEYESSAFDAKAIELGRGQLERLPEPVHKVYDVKQDYVLDLAKPDSSIRNEMLFTGFSAMVLRNTLYDRKPEDVREHFQAGLRRQARQNALVSSDVEGLRRRGEPLKVTLAYVSPNQVIERKGKAQVRVGHLFDAHFEGLDSSRTTAYFREMPVHSVETIRLLKPEGRKSRLDWVCDDRKSPVFDVRCERTEEARQYVLTRTLDMHATKLPAAVLRVHLADIAELNRIREASVYLE